MRVYLHTFGCKANQYDTEVVRQALETAGAVITDDVACADAAVVNSCTVTHTGEAKMRGLVRRIARRRPEMRTVVMGCAAALDDGRIAALPGVTAVVGGSGAADVLDALGLATDQIDPILRSFARGGRAWLKIQDGCDEHCTFCATTLARGASRSRPMRDLGEEAQGLAARHPEIVLTGVHIGSYGADLPPPADLGRLLEYLVSRVPGVRFRLSSIEATEVDDRIADLMVGAPDRLAPHLHAPLQSGSDRLLRRMGRHWYTAARYVTRLERLAARLPTFGLGADVMVGFPGELERDFEATVAVVDALPFTYLHVFPYSERPGAPAGRLGPPVAPDTVSRRAAELRSLASHKGSRYRRARHGAACDAVVTGHRQGRVECLTEDYLSAYLCSDLAEVPRVAARMRWEDGCLYAEPARGGMT